MDHFTTIILAASATAITGIIAYNAAEPPHKACIRECEKVYRPDKEQTPHFNHLFIVCVHKCTGKEGGDRLLSDR